MTVEIKTWTENDRAQIDDTYGYNDILITTRDVEEGQGFVAIDNITDAALAEAAGRTPPAQGELEASGMIRRGDQVFRYGENGPFIIRRSVFTDQCLPEEVAEGHLFSLSEPEARAVAYFSLDGGSCSQPVNVSYVNERLDPQWCEDPVFEGGEEGPTQLVTPWNLGENSQVEKLETALARIRRAKEEGCADPLGQELVAAVSDERLEAMEEAVAKRKDDNKGAAEKVLDQPWYVFAGGTAAAAGIFHYAGKALGFLDSKVLRYIKGRGGPPAAVVVAVISAGAVALSSGEAEAAEGTEARFSEFRPKKPGFAEIAGDFLLCGVLGTFTLGITCPSEAY